MLQSQPAPRPHPEASRGAPECGPPGGLQGTGGGGRAPGRVRMDQGLGHGEVGTNRE